MATIKFQKKSIFFTDEGTGKVIVLIHGFTESSLIWKSFATKLAKLQAMKMDNHLLATRNGTVKKVYVKQGEVVPKRHLLIELK